jgi:hypothetical protein
VHCSEIACQYVDTTAPPCPLRVELFEMPSDRLVAARVTAQTDPTCLECVASALQVTHDEVRRGLWPLCDRGVVRLRPGRCRTCGKRRVVVHAARPRAPHPASALAEPPDGDAEPAGERRGVIQRVLAWLAQAAGEPWCPACLALAARASLEEVRECLGVTGPLRQLAVAPGPCSACGREQPLRATLPPAQRVS